MLEDKDIQKIIEANREVFATKGDLEGRSTKLLQEIFTTRETLEDFREEMRKSFSDLQTSVDAYAKKADTYFQEMVMLSHKVERHEKWIRQLAEKLGIKLEY
jgi:uncharacterized coiled-coil DUF342 family protein